MLSWKRVANGCVGLLVCLASMFIHFRQLAPVNVAQLGWEKDNLQIIGVERALAQNANARIGAFILACGQDMKKFCQAVSAGEGRKAACLADYEAELSKGCRSAVAKVPKIVLRCGEDIHRLCHGVKRGEGRVVRCLEEHSDQVSNDCKSTLKTLSK